MYCIRDGFVVCSNKSPEISFLRVRSDLSSEKGHNSDPSGHTSESGDSESMVCVEDPSDLKPLTLESTLGKLSIV